MTTKEKSSHAGEEHSLLVLVRYMLSHGLVSAVSLGVAMLLPSLAKFILYEWWPVVSADSQRLLLSELVFASLLVIIIGAAKTAFANHRFVTCAKRASLAFVRTPSASALGERRGDRELARMLRASRDVSVLSHTGLGAARTRNSPLDALLDAAFELRVLLRIPPREVGTALDVTQAPLAIKANPELVESVKRLGALRSEGRHVTLRFSERLPQWTLVALGEQLWVRIGKQPDRGAFDAEYLLTFDPHKPSEGLYAPFFFSFLASWTDPETPEFDFDTGDLVYRDGHREHAISPADYRPIPLEVSCASEGHAVLAG